MYPPKNPNIGLIIISIITMDVTDLKIRITGKYPTIEPAKPSYNPIIALFVLDKYVAVKPPTI